MNNLIDNSLKSNFKKYFILNMMLILIAFFNLGNSNLLAQSEGASIGINTIDPSAVLHLDILNLSVPKGLLVPRMNSASMTSIATPANGLLIFNNQTNSFQVNYGTSTSPVWVSLISSTITGDLAYTHSSNSASTFSLINTGVASGTYGSATQVPIISIDSKGRILSATFVSISSAFGLTNNKILVGNGSNVATEVTLSGDATISNTGVLTFANSGVSSGTYGSATQVSIISVDSKGRVTSATFAPISSAFGLSNNKILVGNGSNVATEVSISGDATLANTGNLQLVNTGVTSGTYGSATQVPIFSVDSKGRILSATFTNFSNAFSLNNGKILVGNASNVANSVFVNGDASMDNTGNLVLNNTGVVSGTYGTSLKIPHITVDDKGRITDITNLDFNTAFTLNNGNILIGNGLNQANSVVMIGDATISNIGALTLANSGVNSGTYGSSTQVPVITVDSKGRITSATFTSIASSFGLNDGKILIGDGSNQSSQVTMSGDATISNLGSLSLANSGVNSGTYGSSTQVPIITVDSKGRITSATFSNFSLPSQTLTNGKIFVGNGSNNASEVTMTGDATISNAGVLNFVNAGANSGTFGSATSIPVLGIDSRGRLTYSGTVSANTSSTTSLQVAYDGAAGAGSGRSFTVGNGAVKMSGSNASDVTLNVTNSGNGGGVWIDNSGSGNSLRITNSSSTYLTINSAGNVALGSSSPNELLTLDGVLSMKESSEPSLTTGYSKIYATTDNNLFYKDEAGTNTLLTKEYAIYRDKQTSGTEGGGVLADGWTERVLNDNLSQIGSSISRSGNTITLVAGTYKVRISAPAFKVNGHKMRFKNKTDNSIIGYGTSEYSGSGSDVTTNSTLNCIFTIAATKDFIIEHYVKQDRSTDGFGKAANVGTEEVFTVAYIEKIR